MHQNSLYRALMAQDETRAHDDCVGYALLTRSRKPSPARPQSTAYLDNLCFSKVWADTHLALHRLSTNIATVVSLASMTGTRQNCAPCSDRLYLRHPLWMALDKMKIQRPFYLGCSSFIRSHSLIGCQKILGEDRIASRAEDSSGEDREALASAS